MTPTPTVTALVIPVEGPLETIVLPVGTVGPFDSLAKLQELVGGYIQALPLPDFLNREHGTVYINEEGKYASGKFGQFNSRATDFMVPGIGIFFGDYIAGPAILAGIGPDGETTSIPAAVVDRARLIESEAA